LQPLSWRPDIRDNPEIAHDRGQAFDHVVGDTVEQEIGRPEGGCAMLPLGKQRAVEQDGSGGRVFGHAFWLSRLRRVWQSGCLSVSDAAPALAVIAPSEVPAERRPEVALRRVILIGDVLTVRCGIGCVRALLRAGGCTVFVWVVDSPKAPI
jgi:hypothetical protein